jgi:hypothetical protein
MHDWEEIERLLRVVELSRGHPQLKAIYEAANETLANLAQPPIETDDEAETTEEGDSDE